MFKAIIQTEINGKTVYLPIFASKKTTFFKTIDKAIRAMEKKRIAGRGLVIPKGVTLAEANWSDIYTIAL